MKYFSILLVIIVVILPGCTASEKQKISQPPNIILINVDDMGWRDVGFMGSEYYETPNLDALAAEGMIFTNAYASASNCAPTRACLMSGQWTPRHGIFTVGTSQRGDSKNRKLVPVPNNEYMPADNILIPEVLSKAGYTTCHAGKWHLSDDPTLFGFDVNIGGSHAGNPGSYYPPYKSVPSLDAPTVDYYLTNLIMDKTLQFLNGVDDQPFFLYYSPYAVHTPIHQVDSLLPKYEEKPAWNGQDNAKYATMVENLDIQVGRLIENLKKSGKLENTFILFFLTLQLPQIRSPLHNLFITDIDRDKHNGLAMISQKASNGHREHARAGLQHAPGAATATLYKIFNRVATSEHNMHVLIENGGVQRIVSEAPAHEESSAAAQNWPHHRHIQVYARSNMRWHQPVLVEHVGQQQVVNM